MASINQPILITTSQYSAMVYQRILNKKAMRQTNTPHTKPIRISLQNWLQQTTVPNMAHVMIKPTRAILVIQKVLHILSLGHLSNQLALCNQLLQAITYIDLYNITSENAQITIYKSIILHTAYKVYKNNLARHMLSDQTGMMHAFTRYYQPHPLPQDNFLFIGHDAQMHPLYQSCYKLMHEKASITPYL